MLVVTGSDRTVKGNCFHALVKENLTSLITFTMCRDGCKTSRISRVKESDTNVFNNECRLLRHTATNASVVSALIIIGVEIFRIFGRHSSFLWYVDYVQRSDAPRLMQFLRSSVQTLLMLWPCLPGVYCRHRAPGLYIQPLHKTFYYAVQSTFDWSLSFYILTTLFYRDQKIRM